MLVTVFENKNSANLHVPLFETLSSINMKLPVNRDDIFLVLIGIVFIAMFYAAYNLGARDTEAVWDLYYDHRDSDIRMSAVQYRILLDLHCIQSSPHEVFSDYVKGYSEIVEMHLSDKHISDETRQYLTEALDYTPKECKDGR